uniref:Uncharacterized protein n=1 Tax=virus sp. ctrcb4 TaxID=2825824 RepID=A0A8S5RP73_9VIRU|nr:MAG TPA: hypothetical protein [virus sp. ctrcb4]DAR12755.1 MAG TPA: hypothetical protein [Crassvirales sp.]
MIYTLNILIMGQILLRKVNIEITLMEDYLV